MLHGYNLCIFFPCKRVFLDHFLVCVCVCEFSFPIRIILITYDDDDDRVSLHGQKKNGLMVIIIRNDNSFGRETFQEKKISSKFF